MKKKLEQEPYKLLENSENREINLIDGGITSTLFHSHLNKIFKKHTKIKISFKNLYKTTDDFTNKTITKKLTKYLKESKNGQKFEKNEESFINLFISFAGWNLIEGGILSVLSTGATIPIPIIIKNLMNYIKDDKNIDFKNAYFYSILLILCVFLSNLFRHWSLHSIYYSETLAKGFTQVKF